MRSTGTDMNTMLLHDFAYVPVSAERVCKRVLAEDNDWLAPLAAAAMDEGEALRLRVGPTTALPMLAKTVRCDVGQALSRGDVTVVPLTWRATGAPGLFPVLSADLEIAPLDLELTQLTIHGRYEPPLGAIGRRIDRLLMHRIAEASVRAFLRRLVATLTADGDGEPVAALSSSPAPSKRDA
jgi:hypothetical protein